VEADIDAADGAAAAIGPPPQPASARQHCRRVGATGAAGVDFIGISCNEQAPD
jgi:hypothetical protein